MFHFQHLTIRNAAEVDLGIHLDGMITNIVDGVSQDVDQGGEVHGSTEEGEGNLVGGGATVGGGDVGRGGGACLGGLDSRDL